MSLDKQDKLSRDDRVMIVDAKNIDLDRALINLFMLLKHNGRYSAPRKGTTERTAKGLAEMLCGDPNAFPGFADHKELTRLWLESDFLDLVNRGTEREVLAAPRPIHLNAYKLRNPRRCRDYGAAPQLFRLLDDEDTPLPRQLRSFLLRGVDLATDRFQASADPSAEVDLETLTILRLADREGKDEAGVEYVRPHRPLCTGQGRLLRDDIQRLLVYADVIPRPTWVEYFRTICGLHLALFVRRLAEQTGRWMRDRSMTDECLACPVKAQELDPLAPCPFPLEFIVDMGDRPNSTMGAISQASAQGHLDAMFGFIRDLIGLTKLIQYVDSTGFKAPSAQALIQRALKVYADDDPEFRGFCRTRISAIVGGQSEDRHAQIRDELSDDPFRAYLESILLERFTFHRRYFRELFRSLLSANKDSGMLVSGKTARSPFRFQLGTRLLETLVQIAVVKLDGYDAAGTPQFQTKPILVSELLSWLRRRYGIAIGAAHVHQRALSPEELRALRENEEAFKTRLREVGFFNDLSDAFNAQRVTPRYQVGGP